MSTCRGTHLLQDIPRGTCKWEMTTSLDKSFRALTWRSLKDLRSVLFGFKVEGKMLFNVTPKPHYLAHLMLQSQKTSITSITQSNSARQ